MNARFRILSLVVVGALWLAILLGTVVQAAEFDPGDLIPPQPLGEDKIQVHTIDDLAAPATSLSAAAADSVAILIELAGAPTVQSFVEHRQRSSSALAVVQAQDQLRRLDTAQMALLAAAPLAEAQVIYRIQRTFNGVAVRVDPVQIAAIEALPGVVAVHPLPIYTIERSRSVPLLGTPILWERLNVDGLDGDAVSIGIIDTGIDYLHTDFGGPGSGYDRNDPTRLDDGIPFPTAKVVGGYDFVGDHYNANSAETSIPQPDPDPMDCWGHGTHVAGIAGGYGTVSNGDTYTGTYNTDLDFTAFDIAPGMAPKADLYALKVFGCAGGSQLVNLAVEWAVDPNQDGDFSDRLDVLNLSLGSAFGGLNDPSTVALNNATLAGVAVVAAAGNNGDTYYIVASPGVADGAISVAASSGLQISSFSSRGPRRGDSALKPEVSAPGANIVSASAHTGRGKLASSGTSMAAPHVAGAVALLRQLHPGWTVEEIKALVLNTARYDLVAGNQYPPNRYGAGRSGAGHLDLRAAGQGGVVMYNAENAGQVSLSWGAPVVIDQVTTLKNVRLVNKSALTRTIYLTYSPIVDLPGVTFSILGDPHYQLAPHTTRNVPILFSADANDLRNSADPTVAHRSYFPRHLLSEETGFLYAWPIQTSVTAALVPISSTGGSGSVTGGDAEFEFDSVSRALTYSVSITGTGGITVSEAALRYGSGSASGPIFHRLIEQPSMGIERLTFTGTVVLRAEESPLLAGGLMVLELTQAGEGVVLGGQLEVQDAVSRLPLYAAPRPAAAMRVNTAVLDFGIAAQGVQTISLVGQGIVSGGTVESSAFPTDTVSLVTALELQLRSPKAIGSSLSQDYDDLQYVGIAVTPAQAADELPPADVAQRRILFGVATYGEWTTPSEVTFRIYIDTDEDGNVDYTLRTTTLGSYLGIGASDEFVTVLEDRNRQEEKVTYFVNLMSAAELDTAIFNNNVLLMAVDAADLGLTQANGDFDYLVSSRSLTSNDNRALADLTRLLHYDVAHPGLWAEAGDLGELPTFYDLPTAQFRVHFNRQAFAANRSRGLLLLHHHNAPGNRAEVVEVRSVWPLYLPKIERTVLE